MVRLVAAVLAASALLAGCNGGSHTASIDAPSALTTSAPPQPSTLPVSSSRTPTPTTISPPPVEGGAPYPASQIDSLALDTSTLPPEVMFDAPGPGRVTYDLAPTTGEPLGTCFFIHSMVNDAAVFGSPLAFRQIRDDGMSNLYLIQAIGVYPDAASAQVAYQVIAEAVDECRSSEQGAHVTFGEVTDTSMAWSTSHCGGHDQVVTNVLVRVDTCRVGHPSTLTTLVAQGIAEKIAH